MARRVRGKLTDGFTPLPASRIASAWGGLGYLTEIVAIINSFVAWSGRSYTNVLLLREQVGEAALFSVGADRSLIRKDTEWSALAEPNADIYNFRSLQVFANAYYAFLDSSAWTPYVGAGAGLARLDFGFYVAFHRKSLDEGYPEVFGGSKSNPDAAPEWQRAAAGTLSMKDAPVGEWALGYQLLAGVDRSLADRASLGLKARWASVATVSASLPWTMVRSHRPVHADGQTPFFWDYEFAGLGYLGASLEMRYRL